MHQECCGLVSRLGLGLGESSDGVTFPLEISLSPVPMATGHFILAVIRDATETRRREDLAGLARAAATEQTHRGKELLDRVVGSLFQVGRSLQVAIDLPRELARERITEALAGWTTRSTRSAITCSSPTARQRRRPIGDHPASEM